MSKKREYVITLKDKSDLDDFYNDMETKGGPKFIPNREIPVKDRRPLSRNTHYMLFDNEAESIKKDPRVLAVELSLHESEFKLIPLWSQSSSLWNKSNAISSSHRNWGLFRCVNGEQTSNWGSDGTTNASGSISTTSSGKNVDVVIVDGHIDPAHPEFSVNADGTGGSRVNQYNWFQHNPEVTGSASGTYVYPPYVNYSDLDYTISQDHGAHVASIACGNTCGWARDANIFNISPYASNLNGIASDKILDYVKAFHLAKEVNPETGVKNPTITNHSYGLAYYVNSYEITAVYYKSSLIYGPFTDNQLKNYGIYTENGISVFPVRLISFEADLQDLIDMGVIVVGASGNEYSKIDINSGEDYTNAVLLSSGFSFAYSRGTITAADNVICVGAISSDINDRKVISSNCGPRIDLYAPGRYIMGAVNSRVDITVGDLRNEAYRLTKKSGTSMASPQVAGVLACIAEQWPRIKQSDAIEYINAVSKANQTFDSGSTFLSDYTSLQGSDNRYLYYKKERELTGQVNPSFRHGNRPTSGITFPRTKIFRYGS